MTQKLLGRPLQFGDAEQIAAIQKMGKENMAKWYLVTVKYIEIVEMQRTSVFEILAESATQAEKEATDKLVDRYKTKKSVDIDFLEVVVTEREGKVVPDQHTLDLFSTNCKR